jgi:hypothetical protein
MRINFLYHLLQNFLNIVGPLHSSQVFSLFAKNLQYLPQDTQTLAPPDNIRL